MTSDMHGWVDATIRGADMDGTPALARPQPPAHRAGGIAACMLRVRARRHSFLA